MRAPRRLTKVWSWRGKLAGPHSSACTSLRGAAILLAQLKHKSLAGDRLVPDHLNVTWWSERTRRWPLTTFFALSIAFSWTLFPFAPTSVVFTLLAAWGPAAAAFVTAALAGSAELQSLRARITHWRVPARWYLVALLLPLLISAIVVAVELLVGIPGPVRPRSGVPWPVFVLALGEEIGWRGFALPILLSRVGPWRANVILGTAWALWHLPLFYLPGEPQFDSPFVPFILYTISGSIILALFSQATGGSVVIASLFHGAVNTVGIDTVAASPFMSIWVNALIYGLVAAIAGLIVWNWLPRRRLTRVWS